MTTAPDHSGVVRARVRGRGRAHHPEPARPDVLPQPRDHPRIGHGQGVRRPDPAAHLGLGRRLPRVRLGGGGAGTGKPTPQDVVVRARTGMQSPKILAAVNTGKHLQTALLTCVKPGNRPFTFMTLTFEDVIVTGYYVTPDPKDGVPLDLVHLKFAKVTQRFFTQNPDGTSGQPVVSSFDYRTNTAGP